MDAVLDLTARAIAVIVLIQDTLIAIAKTDAETTPAFSINNGAFLEFLEKETSITNNEYFKVGGNQINYISLDEPLITPERTRFSYDSCVSLINWMNDPLNKPAFMHTLGDCRHYPAAEKWREAIRAALYEVPAQRLELVKALRYMPLQVMLAAGGFELNAKEQRLMQIWIAPDKLQTALPLILSAEDITIYDCTITKLKKYRTQEIKRLVTLIRYGKQDLQKPKESFFIPEQNELLAEQKIDIYDAAKQALDTFDPKHYKKPKPLDGVDLVYPSPGDKDPILFLDPIMMLKEEDTLVHALNYREIPLSFLYIFDQELDEICRARKERHRELAACIGDSGSAPPDSGAALLESDFETIFASALHLPDPPQNGTGAATGTVPAPNNFNHDYNKDAVQSARNMKLWGLAFSGGGIRSATFNLGVLQGLAQKGLIDKFDYLSTVSGGGYLGGWFVSWIARNKSLLKVSDRLNPKRSTDPFAEEVAPIRWLRMYSNYLTPSTGIMSTDSWTVGMTLLRNMLINQVLIMFFLMAFISGIRTLFLMWANPPEWIISIFTFLPFWLMNALFLFIGAILAGVGMLSYHKRKEGITGRYGSIYSRVIKVTKSYQPKQKLGVTLALVVLGCLTAFVFSSWLYRYASPLYTPESDINDLGKVLTDLHSIFFGGLLGLVAVYVMGKYYYCIPIDKRIYGIAGDMIGTLIAAIFGFSCILLVAHIAYVLECVVKLPGNDPNANTYLEFTLLPPLIIEAMTITVVTRMALLGKNFPDERREWWGRIGGRVHRIAVLWIVVMSLIFLGSSTFSALIAKHDRIKDFFVLGWGASLITGLKVAFSSNNPGNKKPEGFLSSFLQWFPLVAPYLFGIAILTYLPDLVVLLENKMIDWSGWSGRSNVILIGVLLTAALTFLAIMFGRKTGVNQFSMHLFYKNRLVRGFLGATRQRHERQKSANPFTGFDEKDDLPLKDLVVNADYFGPYPIINTTVNVSSVSVLDRQDRKAESFTFTPHYCGFDFSLNRTAANVLVKAYDYAYRPTASYAYKHGPSLGTAMTISGAAANPNQGYHSNTATAFLLTLFNIRLGWWIGNPRQAKWKNADPTNGLGYVLSDLGGKSDTTKNYVCLSDGGHFDNMGIYELIRRKCRYIVLCDGEQDEQFSCEGLANAIRRCRIDFGVDIVMDDLAQITTRTELGFSSQQYASGVINYPEDPEYKGRIIYIKSSMTGNEPADVREYAKKNPAFPHQSTGDQFFDEAQFESYRQLGLHIAEVLFKPKTKSASRNSLLTKIKNLLLDS